MPLFKTLSASLNNLDILRSKDDEFDSDFRLTVEVMDLEQNYSTFYEKTVGELDRQYSRHKWFIFLIRNGKLKTMIKECYERWQSSGEEESIMYSEMLRTGGLLSGSSNFDCPPDLHERATEELTPLRKQELQDDIRKKEQRKQELRKRFRRLFDSINDLRRNYADSRQYSFFRRYEEMKLMIKTLIRNDRQRPRVDSSERARVYRVNH